MNRNAPCNNIVEGSSVELPGYVIQQMGVIGSLIPTVNYQDTELTKRGQNRPRMACFLIFEFVRHSFLCYFNSYNFSNKKFITYFVRKSRETIRIRDLNSSIQPAISIIQCQEDATDAEVVPTVVEEQTHLLQQQLVDAAEVMLHPHPVEVALGIELVAVVVLDVVLVSAELVYQVETAEVLVLERQ